MKVNRRYSSLSGKTEIELELELELRSSIAFKLLKEFIRKGYSPNEIVKLSYELADQMLEEKERGRDKE